MVEFAATHLKISLIFKTDCSELSDFNIILGYLISSPVNDQQPSCPLDENDDMTL